MKYRTEVGTWSAAREHPEIKYYSRMALRFRKGTNLSYPILPQKENGTDFAC